MAAQRQSKKRTAILRALQETASHPNAEWVYALLKPEFPSLSLGTVYANLAAFLADGTIVRVATVDGKDRYDADTSEHAHFICRRCHVVLDVPGVSLPPAEVPGTMESGQISYFGICKDCLIDKPHETKEKSS
ncbi:MAG: transcriptional repressor [Oscillospiraceae bacterium]|jgi:Fur family peroxide stress response transcriptional regulator|nr:transcriptional repressor [Oscillospiraceae bacterium]